MNFLSHYYLLENKDDLSIVVGNLLPDLMRGFTKIYNTDIVSNKALQGTSLLAGIEYHLLTDELFHKDAFFIDKCTWIKNLIRENKTPQDKSFIVAHVMVELLIDQYLMEEAPSLAGIFYQKLETALKENLEVQLKNAFQTEHSTKIIRIFKSFIEHRYAFVLSDSAGICQALQQIIGNRIGVKFDTSVWESTINAASIEVKKDLPEFLTKLKKALKNA